MRLRRQCMCTMVDHGQTSTARQQQARGLHGLQPAAAGRCGRTASLQAHRPPGRPSLPMQGRFPRGPRAPPHRCLFATPSVAPLQACAERVDKDESGEAHCTGQYFGEGAQAAFCMGTTLPLCLHDQRQLGSTLATHCALRQKMPLHGGLVQAVSAGVPGRAGPPCLMRCSVHKPAATPAASPA